MPTTSNFGWTTPADTDLVKDGAAAIRTLGNGIDTSLVDLKGGTTGQILSKNSNTDLDYTWVTPNVGDITEVQAGTGISVASGTGPIPVVTNTVATAYDAKGDLIVGTGADTFAKLTVGTNGDTLVADSATATGLKWAAPASGDFVLIDEQSFSAVSAVNFTSKFSSTYDNYVFYVNIVGSQASALRIRCRSGSTDDSSASYDRSYANFAATSDIGRETGQTQGTMGGIRTTRNAAVLEVFAPNLAQTTRFISRMVDTDNTIATLFNTVVFTSATVFDGLSFFPSAGTITGTISLYGLGK